MMRKVINPLDPDPRFADVEIEDRDDTRSCSRCDRRAQRRCGHCGRLLCGQHARYDSWNDDYLCALCVRELTEFLRDEISPGAAREWRAALAAGGGA